MDIRESVLYLSYLFILIIAESRRERNRPKGRRARAWKISLTRPDQHQCQVNRVIWIMQALRMEISVKRQRWVALYPISPCQGSVTEPRPFCVFYPQTMDLQMEIIFLPPHFNPVSVTSLSNGRGLLQRLFIIIIIIIFIIINNNNFSHFFVPQ